MTVDILLRPCCSKSISTDVYIYESKSSYSCRAIASAITNNQKRFEFQLQQQQQQKHKQQLEQHQIEDKQKNSELYIRKQELQNSNSFEDQLKAENKNVHDFKNFEKNSFSNLLHNPHVKEVFEASSQDLQHDSQEYQNLHQIPPNSIVNNSDNSLKLGTIRNFDTSAKCMKNTVAQALITRLHRWCCQLFWLTIVCVIGCCGDTTNKKTAAELRRDIFNTTMRRCKDMNELEVQLLRRLTSPSGVSTMRLRPLHAANSHRRRHFAVLSRQPSPQLFAIKEDIELE